MLTNSLAQDALLLLIAICIVKLILFTQPLKGLPPGPTPLPILHNIRDMPPKGGKDWLHWQTFAQRFGPIGALTTLGTTLIIISDYDMATELLEKQSSISSDRAQPTFLAEMCGNITSTHASHFTDRIYAQVSRVGKRRPDALWSASPQLAKTDRLCFGAEKLLSQFVPLQDFEVCRFLLRVMKQPESLLEHIRTEIGAIVLNISYGYTPDTGLTDPLVDLADTCVKDIGEAAQPGAWMVDLMPPLKYLPSWLPGTAFKQTALRIKATALESAARPWKFVEEQMAQGKYSPSFASNLLEKAQGKMEEEEAFYAKWTALSVYLGGADTSTSGITSFFLAMTWHPEIQQKAREEIDRVVGQDRLPEIRDRASLPYIEAIAKESLRWHPFIPAGIPHLMTQETTIAGYRIPKGAVIIAAGWSMGHDKTVYHNPDEFNPDRFLGPNPEMEPRKFAFGFGRRICPGKLLAEQSIFLTIAKTLAVFDIAGPREGEGYPISFDAGIVSHPHHFEPVIKPRSARHEALIREVGKIPRAESSSEELKNFTSW